MNYILFNAKSKNETNKESLDNTLAYLKGKEVKQISVFEINDYNEFFKSLNKEDEVYLLGGDGTINHFINDIKNAEINNNIYYYPAGTGNDFNNDVKDKANKDGYVLINDIIKNLPTVIVKGKEYKFINGVGYGLDGECVYFANKAQAKNPNKPVSYPAIAVKLLLLTYKRNECEVTVDGETKKYKKSWIAASMKGKYYGGGMMIAPTQNREDGDVSCVVLHGGMRLPTLFLFLNIFKGTHTKNKKHVEIRKGKNIKVKFSKPHSLQIDGELIEDVLEYEVRA